MMMRRVLLVVALCAPISVTAQELPGRHPGYYEAITDLNWARAMVKAGIDQGPAGADERRAISEITAAMVAVHSADLEDGNNPPGQPNPDVQYPHWNAPVSMNASCTGLKHPPASNSSIVSTFAPSRKEAR